jgi:hypothetical protein
MSARIFKTLIYILKIRIRNDSERRIIYTTFTPVGEAEGSGAIDERAAQMDGWMSIDCMNRCEIRKNR